jgi:tetratricopeptide (TPR) repeat protein
MWLLLTLLTVSVTGALAQAPGIEQARAASRQGDYDRAIKLLREVIALSPQNAEAHFCLANAYGGKAQNSGMLGAARFGPKVRSECEMAVALDPRHVEARLMLMQFYAMAPHVMGGSADKAFEQARAIMAIDPIAGHRAFSFIYVHQKKRELARQECIDSIHERPDSPKAHSYFGQYLLNEEESYEAAAAEFETALRLDPKYMPAFYFLGRTAAVGGENLVRGEGALREYLEYTPMEGEPTLARAHYFLGVICEKVGKKAEAKLSYQAALKLNPTMKEASEALKRLS